MKKRSLVTGGTGFIGSETVIALIENGYEPVIVDNLYNSKEAVVGRIETITGVRPIFHPVDCCDSRLFCSQCGFVPKGGKGTAGTQTVKCTKKASEG